MSPVAARHQCRRRRCRGSPSRPGRSRRVGIPTRTRAGRGEVHEVADSDQWDRRRLLLTLLAARPRLRTPPVPSAERRTGPLRSASSRAVLRCVLAVYDGYSAGAADIMMPGPPGTSASVSKPQCATRSASRNSPLSISARPCCSSSPRTHEHPARPCLHAGRRRIRRIRLRPLVRRLHARLRRGHRSDHRRDHNRRVLPARPTIRGISGRRPP